MVYQRQQQTFRVKLALIMMSCCKKRSLKNLCYIYHHLMLYLRMCHYIDVHLYVKQKPMLRNTLICACVGHVMVLFLPNSNNCF